MPHNNKRKGEQNLSNMLYPKGFRFERSKSFSDGEGNQLLQAMKEYTSATRISRVVVGFRIRDIFDKAIDLAYQRDMFTIPEFWKKVTERTEWAHRGRVSPVAVRSLAEDHIEARYRDVKENHPPFLESSRELSLTAETVQKFLFHAVDKLGFEDFLPDITGNGATAAPQPTSTAAPVASVDPVLDDLAECFKTMAVKRKIINPGDDANTGNSTRDHWLKPTKFQMTNDGQHNPTMDAPASSLVQTTTEKDGEKDADGDVEMGGVGAIIADRKILEPKGARRV